MTAFENLKNLKTLEIGETANGWTAKRAEKEIWAAIRGSEEPSSEAERLLERSERLIEESQELLRRAEELATEARRLAERAAELAKQAEKR